MTWNDPVTWQTGDTLSAYTFNEQIRDNQKHLLTRPHTFVKVGGQANEIIVPIQTTNFVPIDNNLFTLNLEHYSNFVDLYFNIHLRKTNQGNVNYIDIFIDNSIYLSSGTNTPLSRGIMGGSITGSRQWWSHYESYEMPPGLHTYQLYMKPLSRGEAIDVINGYVKFGVKES